MQTETEPDVTWVSQLAGSTEKTAARQLSAAAGETLLFRHLEKQHRIGGRPSYIEIDAPFELYALVRLLRPRHVVEVGVSSGVSSAYLLQALVRNGRGTLHSIDRPKIERAGMRADSRALNPSWALPPGRSSGWAVPDRLRGRWDLRIGDKRDVIPLLTEELDSLQLFVYDVPHEDGATREEFRELNALLGEHGVAIADHGPGGELCTALKWWARRRGAVAIGRKGLGLYGFRSERGPAPGRATARPR
jgi:hypothetical protein